MGATSCTAAEVMDASASLMNDTAKTVYTYTAQMPYLNMALAELQESFQLNNVPVTNQSAATITVPIGTTAIGPQDGIGATPPPNYPNDLVEIQGLYERQSGVDEPFIPIVRREFIPHALEDLDTSAISYWVWQEQQIRFVACNLAREVKIDYIRNLFPTVTNQAAVIGVAGVKTFLFYRTAALCSEFIGENPSRANDLNQFAILAMDRVTGISAKGRQVLTTRRRPFMAAYKRRSFV